MFLKKNGLILKYNKDLKYILILIHTKKLKDYQWKNFHKEKMHL